MLSALRLPPGAGSAAAAAAPLLLSLWLWRTAPVDQPQDLRPLLQQAALVQSLPVQPNQPLPSLWRERLPAGLAESLWSKGGDPWLQLWGAHAEEAPFLLVRAGVKADAVPHSLRWGPYRIVAADALALESLRSLLVARSGRRSPAVCKALEGNRPAVYWRSTGLTAMAGAWTPLLAPLQQGCLQLDGLRWWGQVAPSRSPLIAAASTPPSLPPIANSKAAAPLLRLQGSQLAPLLQPLLETPGVRALLRQRYGLSAAAERALLISPFQLELRANAKQSPFQASIWLWLQPSPQEGKPLQQSLRGLPKHLAKGLSSSSQGSITQVLSAEGKIQAGWRSASNGDLLLVLGAAPPAAAEAWPLGLPRGTQILKLWAQPQLMGQRQLMPAGAPSVLNKVQLIQATWKPQAGADGSAELLGSFRVSAGAGEF